MKFTAAVEFDIDVETIETLIDMAGYGIDAWARWANWDQEKRTYTVHFWEDPDVESPMKVVPLSYRQIGHALVKLATNPTAYNIGAHSDVADYLGRWVTSRDAGEIDSDFADAVIQVAIFDTVQYS